MISYTETFGAWQGYARSGAATLLPTAVRVDATAASFAATADAAATSDVEFTGFGQPKALRIHNSMNRPGSPPRGRHR